MTEFTKRFDRVFENLGIVDAMHIQLRDERDRLRTLARVLLAIQAGEIVALAVYVGWLLCR